MMADLEALYDRVDADGQDMAAKVDLQLEIEKFVPMCSEVSDLGDIINRLKDDKPVYKADYLQMLQLWLGHDKLHQGKLDMVDDIKKVFDDLDSDDSGVAIRNDIRRKINKQLVPVCPEVKNFSAMVKKMDGMIVEKAAYLALLDDWINETACRHQLKTEDAASNATGEATEEITKRQIVPALEKAFGKLCIGGKADTLDLRKQVEKLIPQCEDVRIVKDAVQAYASQKMQQEVFHDILNLWVVGGKKMLSLKGYATNI